MNTAQNNLSSSALNIFTKDHALRALPCDDKVSEIVRARVYEILESFLSVPQVRFGGSKLIGLIGKDPTIQHYKCTGQVDMGVSWLSVGSSYAKDFELYMVRIGDL